MPCLVATLSCSPFQKCPRFLKVSRAESDRNRFWPRRSRIVAWAVSKPIVCLILMPMFQSNIVAVVSGQVLFPADFSGAFFRRNQRSAVAVEAIAPSPGVHVDRGLGFFEICWLLLSIKVQRLWLLSSVAWPGSFNSLLEVFQFQTCYLKKNNVEQPLRISQPISIHVHSKCQLITVLECSSCM